MTEWNWLDKPTKISDFDDEWVTKPVNPPPWGDDACGIMVVVEENNRRSVELIGNETDLWSSPGCGCCSEGYTWKIVAWRRALDDSAWEVPTK